MLKLSGVYEIRNTVNGKRYIGSSVNFRKRWAQHRSELRRGCHHGAHLQGAWNKYGEHSFEFKVLLICSTANCLDYEQRCLDGLKPEYNFSRIAGAPMLGRKHAPESLAKMAAWERTAEQRAKVSKAHTGRTHPPEARANMSAAATAREANLTPEQRAQRSAAVSATLIGNTRGAGSKGCVGRVLSLETRAKIALGVTAFAMVTPNHFAGRTHSAETREKMVAAWRRRKLGATNAG